MQSHVHGIYFRYLDNIKSFMGDILADYEHIHAASPYSQLRGRFLLGKSIGGLITAWAAAEHPDKWTGLIGLSGAYQAGRKFHWLVRLQGLLRRH